MPSLTAKAGMISALSVMACGLLFLMPVKVAAVQILVTDQNGTPIPVVNLCISTPEFSVQKTTDQNGRYNFSLPIGVTTTGPATVRTSRNGFVNNQATINMTVPEQRIVLSPGQATPLPTFCGGNAGTATGGSSGCERIANLEVTGAVPVSGGWKSTTRTVSVVAGFTEKPAFYRLTEFTAAERYPESQFNPDTAFAKKNVPWQPVTTPVLTTNFTLTEPHYGTHHLYLQTSLAFNGCVSHARTINVVLEPAQLVSYELTGQALERFVAAAKTRGYQFRSQFKFNKKDKTYCPDNTMLLPSNPAQDGRSSNTVLEDVSASFDVFDGPDLALYWQLMNINGSFPGLPPFSQKGTTPAVVYDKYSEPSCPYCGASALKRSLSWRRLVYEFTSPPPQLPTVQTPIGQGPIGRLPGSFAAVICTSAPDLGRSDQQPSIVKLTLRGPAGEDPVNALGDARSNTLPRLQQIPPPQGIFPRGE
ncbi:MAG: carboxypeptidase-like regulatory domain-containing protein [Nitrospira sp.]